MPDVTAGNLIPMCSPGQGANGNMCLDTLCSRPEKSTRQAYILRISVENFLSLVNFSTQQLNLAFPKIVGEYFGQCRDSLSYLIRSGTPYMSPAATCRMLVLPSVPPLAPLGFAARAKWFCHADSYEARTPARGAMSKAPLRKKLYVAIAVAFGESKGR